MQHKIFEKGEVIFRQGDPCIDMLIVLDGQVGLFMNEDLTSPIKVVQENQAFGERALDSLEDRARTAIALQRTTCLSLDKHEYKEKVFYLEH